MFLATLYQNYVKKMNNKKPHCRNQNSIENCKKWQNRYPNTQIHDISISWYRYFNIKWRGETRFKGSKPPFQLNDYSLASGFKT